MKKSLIAAAALALLASTGAKAADIVTYQQQPVAAPAPAQINWTGLYVGGTIGGSWANSQTKLKGSRTFKADTDPSSFIGGIYAGYNFQPAFLSSSFLKDVVFGVETDWLWNGGDGSASKSYKDFGGFRYRASTRQKWNGATRIRAGYTIGPEGRFLPYIAGGVSYADIRAKSAADGTIYHRGSRSTAGWNIGAGVDYVPPILNDHLVLRAEYRYTDFGDQTFGRRDYTIGNSGPLSLKQKADYDQNDFRVGVAYKF